MTLRLFVFLLGMAGFVLAIHFAWQGRLVTALLAVAGAYILTTLAIKEG